jgi:hypothetical protein
MGGDDLDVLGACLGPTEADAELVVDADAVLAGAVALQRFQPVARRHTQVVQPSGDLQLAQPAPRHRFDVREARDAFAFRKRLRIGALERLDHSARY